MRIFTLVLLLFIVVNGFVFSAMNATPVVFNYYMGSTTIPLSLLLVIVFCLGGGLGLIVGLWMYIRVIRENSRLVHRIKMAEKEVANLRMMPLKDTH